MYNCKVTESSHFIWLSSTVVTAHCVITFTINAQWAEFASSGALLEYYFNLNWKRRKMTSLRRLTLKTSLDDISKQG
jgi:hypothetical protein